MLTYECAQKAKLKTVQSDKHSGLFGAFVAYNNSIVNTAPGPYSKHFIFLLTYEWAQKARALHYTKLKALQSDKHSGLFGAFVAYDKIVL